MAFSKLLILLLLLQACTSQTAAVVSEQQLNNYNNEAQQLFMWSNETRQHLDDDSFQPPMLCAPTKNPSSGNTTKDLPASGATSSGTSASGLAESGSDPGDEADDDQGADLRDNAGKSSAVNAGHTGSPVGCKIGANSNVDWFIAIKKPGELEYMYFSSRCSTDSWQTAGDIQDDSGPIFHTLQQAFSIDTHVNAYNDKPPTTGDRRDSTEGHMKGIFATSDDTNTGFWMLHTVPNFLDISKGSYSYPESGKANGQSFICVSLKKHQLEGVKSALKVSKPPYYPQLGVDDGLPTTGDVGRLDIETRGENKFVLYYRPKVAADVQDSDDKVYDLYETIATDLGLTLSVQSWLRAEGDEPLADTDRVRNVDGSSFGASNRDHSKWALSREESKPWICFGDLNRRRSHTRQGGSALCFENANAWKLFHTAVQPAVEQLTSQLSDVSLDSK